MGTKKPKSATAKASTKASRKLKTIFDVPRSMIEDIVEAFTGCFAGLDARLHARIYAGGIVEDDYPSRIFAPELASLADLPPALLDTKEALPPIELLPETRADLDIFLRRLVLIGEIDTDPNLTLFTAGWPTVPAKVPDWDDHIARLWDWHGRDPAIYKALVGGRFAPLIRYLRQLVREKDWSGYLTLRRDLHVQALLWCARDVQMVVARIAIGNKSFGPLAFTRQLKLSPQGLHKILLTWRGLLESVLDLLYGSPEWRVRALPPPNLAGSSKAPVTRKQLVKGIGGRVEQLAHTKGIIINTLAAKVAAQLGVVADRLRENAPELAVSQPAADGENKPHSLSAFRYSDLPDVAAAAVPILRLVQAEQQMSLLIDELVPLPSVRPKPRAGTALPPYDEAVLSRGWRVRVSQLLRLYRPLLNDRHHEASSTAWPAINAARKFLKDRDQRLTDDHEGDWLDPFRTLYLLDLLPEHRFTVS